MARANPSGKGVAGIPVGASLDGSVLTSTLTYDGYGNTVTVVAPDNQCRATTYDLDYAALPATNSIFVGAVGDNGCGERALVARADYDRGLGAVVLLHDIHEEQTATGYDGFGRIVAVYRPDPVSGAAGTTKSMSVDYDLGAPFSRVHTMTQNGTSPNGASYHESWAYVDGLGRARVALDRADPSAGDAAPWIAGGIVDYDAKGAKQRGYLPFFYSGDPSAFPLAAPVTSPSTRQRYDAFGRALQLFALDGSVSLQSVYHALSVDAWDALDLQPGPHQGTFDDEREGRTRTLPLRASSGST